MRNAAPEQTLSYGKARADMRILELENRCAGNRTVGSNPTLSANLRMMESPFSASLSTEQLEFCNAAAFQSLFANQPTTPVKMPLAGVFDEPTHLPWWTELDLKASHEKRNSASAASAPS